MNVDDVLALGDAQKIVAGYEQRLLTFQDATQAFRAGVEECNRLRAVSDAAEADLAPWSRAIDLLLEARRIVIESN